MFINDMRRGIGSDNRHARRPAIAASDYRAWLDGEFSYVVDGLLRTTRAPFRYDSILEDPRDGKVDNEFEDIVLFKLP